eukprot:1972878-Rhodomonas_salina.1
MVDGGESPLHSLIRRGRRVLVSATRVVEVVGKVARWAAPDSCVRKVEGVENVVHHVVVVERTSRRHGAADDPAARLGTAGVEHHLPAQ